MKKTMIIFVVISVLFHHLFAQQEVASDTSSFAKEQKDDFSFKYLMRSDDIPAYEKIPVLSNYRENQMIKGMIKGGTIGFFPAAGISFLYMDDEGLTWGYGLLAIAGLGAGTLTGGIIGCFRGAKYHKIKTNNPGFHLKKEFIEHEMKMASSLGKPKISFSYYLNIRKKIFFFNELRFGFIGTMWQDGNYKDKNNYKIDYSAHEKKLDINIVKNLNNMLFNPYYGIGFGYSEGYSETYYNCEKVNIKGVFFHPFIGIKLNIYDFFYIRFETDYETSKFYYKMLKLYNSKPLRNLTFAVSFGTYIF